MRRGVTLLRGACRRASIVRVAVVSKTAGACPAIQFERRLVTPVVATSSQEVWRSYSSAIPATMKQHSVGVGRLSVFHPWESESKCIAAFGFSVPWFSRRSPGRGAASRQLRFFQGLLFMVASE
jgi:hypothetical protein